MAEERKPIIKRFSYWGFVLLALGIGIISHAKELSLFDVFADWGGLQVVAGAILISESLESKNV